MEQINIHQAKTHLSRLADRAHEGETIIIAKGGKPWAKLVPVAKNETYAQPEGSGTGFGEPGLAYQGAKPVNPVVGLGVGKRELGWLADRDWYVAPDWKDDDYVGKAVKKKGKAMNKEELRKKRMQGLGMWEGKVTLPPDWDDNSDLIDMMTNIAPDDPLWEFSTDNPKNKQ